MIRAQGSAFVAALVVAGLVACAATSERARADQQVAERTVGDTTQPPDERASGVCEHIDLEAVAAYGIHKLRRSMIVYYDNRKFYEVMADRIFDVFSFNRAAIIRKMDLVDCDRFSMSRTMSPFATACAPTCCTCNLTPRIRNSMPFV